MLPIELVLAISGKSVYQDAFPALPAPTLAHGRTVGDATARASGLVPPNPVLGTHIQIGEQTYYYYENRRRKILLHSSLKPI